MINEHSNKDRSRNEIENYKLVSYTTRFIFSYINEKNEKRAYFALSRGKDHLQIHLRTSTLDICLKVC